MASTHRIPFSLLLFGLAACSSTPPDSFSLAPTFSGAWPERLPSALEKPLAASDELPTFYRKLLALEDGDWAAIELAEEWRLVAGKPVPDYFNTHLLRHRAKNGIARYFRPVDTTTGCTSGCTPVVFHLVLDEAGRVERLLEDPAFPLRKVGHQVFSDEDRRRALQTARELPAALRYVDDPVVLTDSLSVFPPQTWSAFRASLVPGGAYTSYRIFEAALGARRALAPSDAERETERSLLEALTQERNALSGWDDARRFVARRLPELEDTRLPVGYRAGLLQTLLKGATRISSRDPRASDSEWLFPLFRAKTTREYGRRRFCEYLAEASASEIGAAHVVAVFRERASFPECEASFDATVSFLAATTLKRVDRAREFASRLDFSSPPEFLKNSPERMELYAQAAADAGKAQDARRLRVEILVRYPRHKLRGARPDEGADGKLLRETYESVYRGELKRGFLDPPREIVPVLADRGWNREEKEAVRLPGVEGSARLYVFFASWCPHCLETIGGWAKEDPGDDFWKRIRLVEVFPREGADASLESFCKATGLAKGPRAVHCREAARLGASPAHEKFLERLEIYGVPSAVLVNGRGQIVSTSFELSSHPSADIARDLRWVLEDLDRSTP